MIWLGWQRLHQLFLIAYWMSRHSIDPLIFFISIPFFSKKVKIVFPISDLVILSSSRNSRNTYLIFSFWSTQWKPFDSISYVVTSSAMIEKHFALVISSISSLCIVLMPVSSINTFCDKWLQEVAFLLRGVFKRSSNIGLQSAICPNNIKKLPGFLLFEERSSWCPLNAWPRLPRR